MAESEWEEALRNLASARQEEPELFGDKPSFLVPWLEPHAELARIYQAEGYEAAEEWLQVARSAKDDFRGS